MRPFTLISAILFVLSGAYLFAVKHRSETLNNQIAATAQATRLDAQRIRVLQAQWALEVDPSRLAQLSAKFTQLQPMQPSQLVTLASLEHTLPPAGSAVPGSAPVVPTVPAQAPASVVAAAVPAAQPETAPASTPVKEAAAAPAPAPRSVKPHPEIAVRDARMGNVETLLHNLPQRRAVHVRQPVHEYAENRPSYVTPSALAVAAAPPVMEARVVPVRAIAQATPAPMPMDGGSMLGMAQDMSSNGSAN